MIPEPEFLNIQWGLKSRLFEASCLFKGQSVQQGLHWLQLFVLLIKTFVKTVQKTLKLDQKWSTFAFCIEKKYPQAYLEALHSHFQPNCHFKMFKNSGSGIDDQSDFQSDSR
jgi:hypothetical protein